VIQEKLDVSVIILARNEGNVIDRCIRSAEFAHEIIVVDSGSTDDTREVAKSLGARVVSHPWPGDFSVQRSFADTLATHDWVMHIDADERVSTELAAEIQDFFHSGSHQQYVMCKIPMKEYLLGKWIEHGGFYPQYKHRLLKRGSGRWVGRVHEKFVPEGEVKTLNNPLLHDSYRDIQIFIDKINRYSSMDAEEIFKSGKKFSLFRLFFMPAERFFGRFIKHRGYKDGFHGFVLAALIGLNYFLRYLKLWEKYYFEEKRKER
jgi:glycosyltransferase involved in cell wall biosynthesis